MYTLLFLGLSLTKRKTERQRSLVFFIRKSMWQANRVALAIIFQSKASARLMLCNLMILII